jgi:hypothetical protein
MRPPASESKATADERILALANAPSAAGEPNPFGFSGLGKARAENYANAKIFLTRMQYWL